MPTVLIIDNDEGLLDMTAHRLEVLGADACTATNGYEALALLSMGGIDLVITHANMPDMDGIELALRIRSDHHGIPVVAQSGHLPEASEAFFDGVLSRPASLAELSDTLLRCPTAATAAP